MPSPQQPELRRSEKTPEFNRDEIEGELEARGRPTADRAHGDVPPDNRPGPTAGPDQDKPEPGDRPG